MAIASGIAYSPMAPVGRGDPFGPSPIGPPPFQPPVGPTLPGTPIGAGVCPPGTRCVGPSMNVGGLTVCLGTCAEMSPGIPQPDPSTPIVPPTPGLPPGPGTGVCDLPTRAFCEATCGTNQGGGGAAGGNGCSCQKPCSSCCLPNGRRGKLNKSRYYRFGDCRRGTGPGVVEPGTVCIAPRRMNPMNHRAAMRAVRRVTAATNTHKKLMKALKAAAGPSSRRK